MRAKEQQIRLLFVPHGCSVLLALSLASDQHGTWPARVVKAQIVFVHCFTEKTETAAPYIFRL